MEGYLQERRLTPDEWHMLVDGIRFGIPLAIFYRIIGVRRVQKLVPVEAHVEKEK
jgi:hypothetical protein